MRRAQLQKSVEKKRSKQSETKANKNLTGPDEPLKLKPTQKEIAENIYQNVVSNNSYQIYKNSENKIAGRNYHNHGIVSKALYPVMKPQNSTGSDSNLLRINQMQF